MTASYGREVVGEQPLADQATMTEEMPDPGIYWMSRNPSVTLGKVHYRGYEVPYVEVFKVPVGDDGQQTYPLSANSDGTTTVHPHDGKHRYELTFDNRWAYDFATEAEVLHVVGLVADAMAVAAGWACHGSANRLNRHGPTVAARPPDPNP